MFNLIEYDLISFSINYLCRVYHILINILTAYNNVISFFLQYYFYMIKVIIFKSYFLFLIIFFLILSLSILYYRHDYFILRD